jgi:hypothetical protein
MNMRIQAIREWINAGLIAIHFVPTDHNVADMLTKALPRPIIERHRDILMMGHGGVEKYVYCVICIVLCLLEMFFQGFGFLVMFLMCEGSLIDTN